MNKLYTLIYQFSLFVVNFSIFLVVKFGILLDFQLLLSPVVKNLTKNFMCSEEHSFYLELC